MAARVGGDDRRGRRARAWVAMAVAALVVAGVGCASGGSGSDGSDGLPGAASPEDAIQSFLNAAKRDDYATMASLFGNTQGPAVRRLGRSEVERRMFVLASLLEHDGYALRRSGLTEGPDALRYMVEMTGTRNGNVTVPFIVATDTNRWYVQQVVTQPLTGTTR